MTTVKYRTPYECTFSGHDDKSGKPVRNILHFRCGYQGAGEPAYGADVPGPSDLATFATNLAAAYEAAIDRSISTHLIPDLLTIKQILGWSVGGTPLPVVQATNTNPSEITTLVDHNYQTGDTVTIVGAIGNTAINGTWVIDVVSPTKFEVPVAGNGVYLGGGSSQKVNTPVHLVYGDQAQSAWGAGGPGNGGDAMTLISSVSVQKRTAHAGRNGKGGIRLAPVAESDNDNGGIVAVSLANMQADWNTFQAASIENGGNNAISKLMKQCVFSKTLALVRPTPFTASDPFCFDTTALVVNKNLGSVVRRKPKLNAPITMP